MLELELRPRRMLNGDALDNALAVAADFIDLEPPDMGGHSRRCAELAADAARVLGFTGESITTLRRAAMVHDFGSTAVPSSIRDKPGSLTRAEFDRVRAAPDRVELHPMLTEQMLRRSPALDVLNPVACAHHEKCDGSGYHRRIQASAGDPAAWVPAATEVYVGLTAECANRPAFSPGDAAKEHRRLEPVDGGVLHSASVPRHPAKLTSVATMSMDLTFTVVLRQRRRPLHRGVLEFARFGARSESWPR